MEYLEAALTLKSLIRDANSGLLDDRDKIPDVPNRMMWVTGRGEKRDMAMESFTNGFVRETLSRRRDMRAFVVTDLANMIVNGQSMTYLLYKGYHSLIEKGLVYYQIVEDDTLEPRGPLLFSNLEDNIFYSVREPESEESSCNTMETDRIIEDGKSIVFFIGHSDEDRLVYDIERLIFDTVNNVTKHPRLKFEFIIQIARYGDRPTEELRKRVRDIAAFTGERVFPEYPNATFEFTYEEDMA